MSKVIELLLAHSMMIRLDQAGVASNVTTMRIVTKLNVLRTVTAEQMVSVIAGVIPRAHMAVYRTDE